MIEKIMFRLGIKGKHLSTIKNIYIHMTDLQTNSNTHIYIQRDDIDIDGYEYGYGYRYRYNRSV